MRRRPTRLVLLGHPVDHSLSPRFQNAALTAAGLPLTYEALDVSADGLERCLLALRDAGAAGNVTIPHKERVAAICERMTSDARRAAAVNTFWVEDGRLVGDNTDIGGFTTAAAALLGRPMHSGPIAQRGGPTDLAPIARLDEAAAHTTIALLGAGGAAAAVLCAAESWPGCRVLLYSRTASRAAALCARFPAVCEVAGSAEAAVRSAALVVNATPLGLHDDAMPVEVGALSPTSAVLDLVYRPGETAFVRAARARGLRAADGLAMLIEQGALAFERWFGAEPDREAMWHAVDRPFEAGQGGPR